MRITNAGRGVHKREIKGIDHFRAELPADWYAYTNLDLVLGVGRVREIDVVIVSNRRIFLIDLKDWYGKIASVDGRWHLNGMDIAPSPVTKIAGITREILPLLTAEFKKRPETRGYPLPSIVGLVVLTGQADCTDIAETERGKVLTAREFLSLVKDDHSERKAFGNIPEKFLSSPLTGSFWKERLHRFFNAGPSSPFKPGRRRFERFTAEEAPTFTHPKDIYCEYEAFEEGDKNNLGTLRLWDFTKCPDVRFQNEEGRREIAGRERLVYHWLKDRSNAAEQTLLPPKIDDPERGVHYWEVYDRRRRMQRLAVFAETEGQRLAPTEKIELARQILASVENLHRHDAAHLDLGGHSIWLEAPTTAKFSHLMAARFPEVKSLGESRYQFLASVDVPEDHLGVYSGPKCRDVFLAAVAVHQLLFGKIPDGRPPEWNPAVDESDTFCALHDWFAEALELDPSRRYPDAVRALQGFNRATAQRPTREDVLSGLDRHRSTIIKLSRQLVAAYPEDGELIAGDACVEIWRSQNNGDPVIVKLWKQALWGDTIREGSTILAFLEKAAAAKADRPAGLPTVREVLWLDDAIAIVQDWIEGSTLAEVLDKPPEEFRAPAAALSFVERLTRTVEALHESGRGHGDLKPANIVITADNSVVLIDALDFSPPADGERSTSAYATSSGNLFERDRFAVTKIAEEILACASLNESDKRDIAKAITACREKEPCLSTLLPLLDQVEAALVRVNAPMSDENGQIPTNFVVSIAGVDTGPIDPDEGYIFLRVYRDKARGTLSLVLRGAVEELDVRLDNSGQMVSARRRKLEQRQIKRNAAHEFHMVEASLSVDSAAITNLSALTPLLALPEVKERIDAERTGSAPAPLDAEDPTAVISDEMAEDTLAEEVAPRQTAAPATIDVPTLWRALIDVENELTIEGMAQLDSVFDHTSNRHKVPIELESGAFEFARHDTVGVERQDRKGGWRRIGQLDLQSSRSDLAVIDAGDTNATRQVRLVDTGQRLRFWSHLEQQSLKRRTDAVDRILAGNGRSRDLLGVFDPRTNVVPLNVNHQPTPGSLGIYGLNSDQQAAFRRIVASRPIGLLQGPPGTGKTRFIAALAHYALTKGLARNVLLASQSHEAVNTAAEAVLTLFRNGGAQPSLLRIGRDEEQVSLPLRAYHTPKVEQSFKDRFRASFRDRLAEIARVLGLPESAADEISAIETTIRPLTESIAELTQQADLDQQRLNSMLDTLRLQLERLQTPELLQEEAEQDWQSFPDDIAQAIMQRYARAVGAGADRIDRLYRAAGIGRDFVGSISRTQRSFESFLAGTRQIVAGTCVGLGRTALGLTTTAFDLVIVDEAARCTASELLVPLQAARWAVLVGDQAQLEPQHKAEVVNAVAERTGIPKREIKRSDFERVFTTSYGGVAGARLKTQYRMLAPIGELVSETFYPDLPLEAGRETPEIDPALLPPGLDVPLLWVETDGMGEAAAEQLEEGGSSRINRVEADAIVAMLEDWHSHEPFRNWLLTQQKYPAGIGVICMYAAQRDLIRRRLRQSGLAYLLDHHLKVGTVDSYQGKENPVVLLSLVRNNEEGPMEAGVRRIREGFLTTPNRINVAASRAMDRLIIAGVRGRWSPQGPMGRMAEAFERQIAQGAARTIHAEDITGRTARRSAKNKSVRSGKVRTNGGANG